MKIRTTYICVLKLIYLYSRNLNWPLDLEGLRLGKLCSKDKCYHNHLDTFAKFRTKLRFIGLAPVRDRNIEFRFCPCEFLFVVCHPSNFFEPIFRSIRYIQAKAIDILCNWEEMPSLVNLSSLHRSLSCYHYIDRKRSLADKRLIQIKFFLKEKVLNFFLNFDFSISNIVWPIFQSLFFLNFLSSLTKPTIDFETKNSWQKNAFSYFELESSLSFCLKKSNERTFFRIRVRVRKIRIWVTWGTTTKMTLKIVKSLSFFT